MIHAEPAFHPRWLDEGSVLVLRPNDADDLAKGASLERIVVADGTRSRVAELSAFACQKVRGGAELFPLAIQSPWDFAVDATGRLVCMTLMDRNLNMKDIKVDVRIDLESGKVSRFIEVGQSCKPSRGVEIGHPRTPSWQACGRKERPASGRAFRFAFDEGMIVELVPGSRPSPRVRLSDYTAEDESPSGRWRVLGGDIEEGDYIHRRIVLLDREAGEVFPIPEAPGAWPRPLEGSGAQPPFVIALPKTASVVGETDLRWLGEDDASELLVVDRLVVRPGGATFAVDGEVAR